MSVGPTINEERCHDCGARPPEWGPFDRIEFEGEERERWHCVACDAYGIIIPPGPADVSAEEIAALLRECRDGSFYNDHDASLELLDRAEKALTNLLRLARGER